MHIYRMNLWQHVIGLSVLAIGLVVLVGIWGGVISGTWEPRWYEMMIPVIISAGASVFVIRAFHNKVCLSTTAIEVRGLTGKQVLPLERIKGRRRYLDRGGYEMPRVWHLVLEPNDDRFPKLDIDEIYRFDDFFYAWFNGFPDLDDVDRKGPEPSDFGLA